MFCKQCGSPIKEDVNFCFKCGAEIKKSQDSIIIDPSVKTESQIPEVDPKLKGIGGWLILVMIGLFITIGFGIDNIYTDVTLSINGTATLLSNPSSELYIPGYNILLAIELTMLCIMAISACYLLYLFFKKDHKFPKYYIIFLIATAIFTVIDYFMLIYIFNNSGVDKTIADLYSQETSNIFRQLIGAVVWISYIIKSKRVKATFIKT